MLEQLVMKCGPYIHGIFEGVLKTIIIQAWGAFEALARMLWEKALESGNASIVRPTEKEWKKERLGFGSRGGIRRSFDFGFRIHNAPIRSGLDPQIIDPLAVMRNVLVHHAGKVDADFIGHRDGLTMLDGFSALPLNAKIEIDGAVTRNLVDPAIERGYALIVAIDAWLVAHP